MNSYKERPVYYVDITKSRTNKHILGRFRYNYKLLMNVVQAKITRQKSRMRGFIPKKSPQLAVKN